MPTLKRKYNGHDLRIENEIWNVNVWRGNKDSMYIWTME